MDSPEQVWGDFGRLGGVWGEGEVHLHDVVEVQGLEKRVGIGNTFWIGVRLLCGVQWPPMAQNDPREKAFRMKYVVPH